MSRKLTKFSAGTRSGAVDRENGIIKGISLIQANREARGHEMFIDLKMVSQVVKQGKETGDIGLKARFDHPSSCFSSMGSQVGRFKNFRRKGDKALADLHIADFASTSPQGDLRTHLLDIAEEDPDMVGFSIVFTQAEPETFDAGEGDDAEALEFLLPHARLGSLHACDVVDEAAANDGMFSIFGRPNYLKEQVERYLDEAPELLTEVLEPAIEKYFKGKSKESIKDIKENINQKSIQMSDEKSSLEAEFAVTPEAVEQEVTTVEEVDNTEDLDNSSEADVALEEANKTISEFRSELENIVSSLKEATDSNEALKAEIESLRKESIGDTIEPAATGEVELNEEGTEEKTLEEKVAFWAKEQASGNTASLTYIKNNK